MLKVLLISLLFFSIPPTEFPLRLHCIKDTSLARSTSKCLSGCELTTLQGHLTETKLPRAIIRSFSPAVSTPASLRSSYSGSVGLYHSCHVSSCRLPSYLTTACQIQLQRQGSGNRYSNSMERSVSEQSLLFLFRKVDTESVNP